MGLGAPAGPGPLPSHQPSTPPAQDPTLPAQAPLPSRQPSTPVSLAQDPHAGPDLRDRLCWLWSSISVEDTPPPGQLTVLSTSHPVGGLSSCMSQPPSPGGVSSPITPHPHSHCPGLVPFSPLESAAPQHLGVLGPHTPSSPVPGPHHAVGTPMGPACWGLVKALPHLRCPGPLLCLRVAWQCWGFGWRSPVPSAPHWRCGPAVVRPLSRTVKVEGVSSTRSHSISK